MEQNLTFADLGLSEEILQALEKKGYGYPTRIQAEAIPEFMQWKDVIAKAPTGTGKTFAFGIPMIEHIDAESEDLQGLILAPTRELAIQICDELRGLLTYYKNIRVAVVYGGAKIEGQIKQLKNHPQIVVLDNPNRTVPYAMNIGIANSSAPVIVRLDAHAEYPADYIRLSVETLLTQDCDNAGGVFETHGRGFMGEAIAEMLKTPLGVGNATYRLTTEDGYVDTVPFGCFKRELFERIGGFDERMTRNQDNELNFRIRKNGGKIYLNHNIRVQYYCRDTMRGIMKMGYMNGKWNVITMTLVPGSMGVRHFVPLAFVLSTILLVLLTLLTRSMLFGGLLALEWGAYLLLDFFYSYTIAKEKGWKFLPVEIILYPAFHFAYGFGSLCGIAALPKFVKAEKEKKKAGDRR